MQSQSKFWIYNLFLVNFLSQSKIIHAKKYPKNNLLIYYENNLIYQSTDGELRVYNYPLPHSACSEEVVKAIETRRVNCLKHKMTNYNLIWKINCY